MTWRVILTASAHTSIETVCRAELRGRETGGVLLGHEHPDRRLVVTVAGDPGPRAEQTRDAFHRDPKHAHRLAHDRYAHDRSVWLGDWHTHPNGPAHPSPADLRAYASIVGDPTEAITAFLSIIAVPGAPRPLLDAWIITQHALEPATLWIR